LPQVCFILAQETRAEFAVGGKAEIARAKEAAENMIPFQSKYRLQSARETWANYLKSPCGMDRFKSPRFIRMMHNLRHGYAADYDGFAGEAIGKGLFVPVKPLVSDEQMADIEHDQQRNPGKALSDSTLEVVAPEVVEKRRRGRPKKGE